ncbi:DUF4870 domain-containing protein [Flavobacterium sp.]|uniref:DUF4870 domain-containing protein n=1 Tax=Flavobacterium sp. TaxID=239 RepID=UPI003750A2B3
MNPSNERTVSSLTHLSALSQYFIPFGNFIFPIIIWSSKKKDSDFVNYNGKQILNFQLSILLYSIILCMIAVPIIIYMVFKNVAFSTILNGNDFEFHNFNFNDFTGMAILALLAIIIFGFLKIIEFILIVYAAVKASNGEKYKYPLTIPFFK